MITWQQWLDDASGGDSARQIASKICVSPSSVAKWIRTGRPPAEAIVACSRIYDADLIAGMIAANIISEDDVRRHLQRRLRFFPSRLLLAELMSRVRDDDDTLKHDLPSE